MLAKRFGSCRPAIGLPGCVQAVHHPPQLCRFFPAFVCTFVLACLNTSPRVFSPVPGVSSTFLSAWTTSRSRTTATITATKDAPETKGYPTTVISSTLRRAQSIRQLYTRMRVMIQGPNIANESRRFQSAHHTSAQNRSQHQYQQHRRKQWKPFRHPKDLPAIPQSSKLTHRILKSSPAPRPIETNPSSTRHHPPLAPSQTFRAESPLTSTASTTGSERSR